MIQAVIKRRLSGFLATLMVANAILTPVQANEIPALSEPALKWVTDESADREINMRTGMVLEEPLVYQLQVSPEDTDSVELSLELSLPESLEFTGDNIDNPISLATDDENWEIQQTEKKRESRNLSLSVTLSREETEEQPASPAKSMRQEPAVPVAPVKQGQTAGELPAVTTAAGTEIQESSVPESAGAESTDLESSAVKEETSESDGTENSSAEDISQESSAGKQEETEETSFQGEWEESVPETSEESTEEENSVPETAEPETAEPETAEPETAESETAEPETSESETAGPEELGEHTEEGTQKDSAQEISVETAGEEGEKTDSGDSALENLSETIEEIIEETRSVVEALTRTRKMRRLVFATPGDTVQTATPGQTVPDEKEPDDTETDDTEPEDPFILTVTIHGGALKAVAPLADGKIRLEAGMNDGSVKTETTVKVEPVLFEGLSPTTDPADCEPFTKNIYWIDNKNEAKARKTNEEMAKLIEENIRFTVDGTTYDYTLENVNNILKMELDELPKPNVKAGDQSLTVSYGDTAFPKWLGYKDDKGDFINAYEITWTFTPPAVSQYDPQDVNEDTISSYPSLQAQAPGCYGWYYLLVEEQKFNIVLRSGASYNAEGNLNYDEVKKAILENFQVCVDRPGNPTLVKLPLQGMMEGNEILYEVLTELPEGVEDAPDAANKMAVITVTNGWKYNVNGARMKYWIDMVGQTDGEDPQIDAPLMVATGATADAPEGPQDDTTGKYKNHLKVTYDNTGTIYSDQEGGTYPDGKLILTLSSEAYYEATKVWNDQGVQNVERPTATMELWRYRNGEDYTSATPVRNNENKIVTVELGKDTTIIDANTEKVTIAAENRLFLDSMPKYDSEGYRYIYVLKEFMSGTNADKYQQVMGSIKQTGDNAFEITDTLPTWLPKYEEGFTPASDGQRLEGNTFLYNGGTLSNCLDVDTTVSAVKSWKAASFQADFDNVAVELTLQYRPLKPDGTPDGNWAPVIGEDGKEVQQMKYGFTEEELAAWNVSATAPKYGLLGRLLEYRWVESAVYQASEGADLEEYCASSGAKNLLNTDGSFSLKQNGRTVHYRSTAIVSTPSNAETPVTAIVNRMEDTIDYTVEKKWEGDLTPQEVSFAIYRLRSGDSLNNATEEYLSFTLFPDGSVKFNGQVPQEGITIENVDGNHMKARISGLPEFDEHGAEYQYVLLEDYAGAGWIPGYTTTRDENRDYNTTVVNAPGPGQRIMVRKEWTDDSDVTHREEVTVEVYVDGKRVKTVPLNKNNEWSALVSVTDPANPNKKIDMKNIYIKETEAGGNTVKYSKNTDWNNLSSVTGEYESDFHRYEVTYEEPQNILGEDVFTVRNRRVNEVNLTVTKIWKDNNGMLRKALTEAFDKIFTDGEKDKRPVLSLKLRFATDEEERGCRIEKDATGTVSLVSVGSPANAQPIQDDQGFQVSHIQPVDYGTEGGAETGKWQDYEDTYYFWNLPKYDATGAVLHYTVDELWLTPAGDPIENLEVYLKDIDENVFETYPDLKELLSEHTISITEQKYVVGENEEPGNSASLGGEILPYTYQYTRGKAIVPDQQTMTFQNALTGTKSVYWHKLWDDAYAFSRGNRPDIYMDIFQVVQVEDNAGQLKQSIKLFKKDYRWDATTSTDLGAVIDKGNDLNHWHVVLDNLPKYDPVTGREYYYYAVERAMVNIKQFDYNDVAYYFTKTGTKDTGTGEGADKVDGRLTWPDTGTKNLTKVGMARMSKENVPSEYEGSLAFDYNAPAKLILVSEDNKGHVPEGKFYDYPHYMLLEDGYFSNTLQEDVIIQGQKLWVGLPDSYPDTSLPAVKFNLYRRVDTTGKGEEETRTDDPGEFVASTTITDWVRINKNGTYKFQMTHYTDEDGKPVKVTVDENGTKILEEVDSVEEATKLPHYDEQGFRYVYTLVEEEIFWDDGGSSTPLRSGDPEKPEDDRAGIFINTTQVGSKDFTSTNSYKGVNGSLSVRKILKLEPSSYQWSGGWVYPNVRFKLTRQYKNEEDNLIEDASFSRTVTWTKSDIKSQHKSAGEPGYVTGNITFDNLEVYAPNGSPWIYTVTEDTDFLKGYNTWVQAGKVEYDQKENMKADTNKKAGIEDLHAATSANVEPAATFLNEYQRDNPKMGSMEIRKIWMDYENALGLRPDSIEVTVYRTAESQVSDTDNNNYLWEKFAVITLPLNKNNKVDIKYASVPDADKTIKPESCTLTEKNDIYINQSLAQSAGLGNEALTKKGFVWTLEKVQRYAPNGNEWKYVIVENENSVTGLTTFSPYEQLLKDNQGNKTHAWGWWGQMEEKHYNNPLINSLYASASFKKQWKNADGEIISKDQDYLGEKLSVTFQLQVQEQSVGGNGVWTPASEYFNRNLNEETIKKLEIACPNTFKVYRKNEFEQTITAKVNEEPSWKGSFIDLPGAIKASSGTGYVKLNYRVVETSVKFEGVKPGQTITLDNNGNYSVSGDGLVKSAEFQAEGNVSINTLDTTSLTIEKRWNDSFNQYHTRPMEGEKWVTSFAIQRRVGTGAWETFKKIKLSAAVSDPPPRVKISGLPLKNSAGESYEYRARELEYGTDNKIIENDGSFYNNAYTVRYDEKGTPAIATNILNRDITTYRNYEAKKVWYPENPLDEEKREAVFELQYRNSEDTNSWVTLATVTLDGTKDTLAVGDADADGKKMVYGEDEPWHAVWKDVPLRHPESYLPKDDSVTRYQVVEKEWTPGDYISRTDPSVDPSNQTYTFTFRNIQPTSFTVKKEWFGTDEAKQMPVTVSLYQTDDPERKGGQPYKVDDVAQTAILKKDNNWSYTFERLPAYSDDGKALYYYAVEEKVGGESLTKRGFHADYTYDKKEAQPGETVIETITNSPTVDLTGTKTWKDYGNAYNTRPETLKLTLQRRRTDLDADTDTDTDTETDTGTDTDIDTDTGWKNVDGAEPVWKDTDTDVWTYTYENLPTALETEEGQGYHNYQYRVLEESVPGYESVKNENNFTNTLTGKTEFHAAKHWITNGSVSLPTLVLHLQRQVDGSDTWEAVRRKHPQWTGMDTYEWNMKYSDLEQYTEDGKRYIYRVTEDVPEGYDGQVTEAGDGETLINVQRGSLTVAKTVSGNKGDTAKEFHFKVTLNGTSIAGIKAVSISSPCNAEKTAMNETRAVQIAFIEGVSETFVLKHGEKLTIQDIPAGLDYEVEELEADQDGYVTTAAGDQGQIAPGQEAQALFENRRHVPDEPDKPEKPDRPDDDDDDDSYTPRTPRDSGGPNDPKVPVILQGPGEPNHPGVPDKTPVTSDPTRTWLWLLLSQIFLVAAVILILRERRKD